jgi:hypothetical protein
MSAVVSLAAVPVANPAGSETARFLDLAAAQVEVALREGEADLGALTEAFATVGAELQTLRATTPTPDVVGACARMESQLAVAVVAFQFFDRLSQRLQHVQEALQRIAGMVSDGSDVPGHEAWERLRRHIRASYSMEHERLMFDLLVGGASADEVLAALAALKSGGSAGHVELF